MTIKQGIDIYLTKQMDAKKLEITCSVSAIGDNLYYNLKVTIICTFNQKSKDRKLDGTKLFGFETQ